ncbi:MAG: nuclear transport factor 2 family protein [Gaiellales bacterium]
MQHDATPAGLERAFGDWAAALNALDLDTFYSFFAEDSEILDEDYPWRMTKVEFVDHIAFHSDVWESFQWVPRETAAKVWGTTGHVSGFSTFRGKPRDAGFRQRFMGFTTTWAHRDGQWVLVSWHQSVLAGRILGASPS